MQTNMDTGTQRKLRYVPNGMTQSTSATVTAQAVQSSMPRRSILRTVCRRFQLNTMPTTEIMVDPVMLVEDGHTYERATIARWIAEKGNTGDGKVPNQLLAACRQDTGT